MRKVRFKIIIPFMIQFISWPFFRLFFKFFMHLEIKGLENLKSVSSKVIFAPNHAHELDSWLVRAALPWFSRWSPMIYVTAPIYAFKESNKRGWLGVLYRSGILQYVFALWGAYPLERGNGDYAKSLRTQVSNLKDGYPLCMYPEGKITEDGKLQEFHGGIVYLASETKASIIPVAIKGTYKLSLKNIFLRKARVFIYYGKSIEIKARVKESNKDTYEVLVNNVRENILIKLQ